MTAEPYVQLVFNYLTKKVLEGTQPTGPQAWQVTSDAAGKVVIRDHQGTVLGIGKWHFNATIDRVRSRISDKLDDARWDAIDNQLYGLLEQARARGPADPTRLDPAVIAQADVAPTPIPELHPAFKQMQPGPPPKAGKRDRNAEFANVTADADVDLVNSLIKGKGKRR